MDIPTIAAGMTAAKAGFDTLRAAVGFARDAKDLLPSGDHKDQVGAALDTALRKLAEGEAVVAISLGYVLCRCEFPPTPMLRVGHLRYMHMSGTDRGIAMARDIKTGDGVTGGSVVHECPKCKRTDAPSYSKFERDGLIT